MNTPIDTYGDGNVYRGQRSSDNETTTLQVDWETEAADARMDALMLLEHLKVAIERLEYERSQYHLTPIYLEEAIRNLKQTARDYDFKLKGENDGRSAKL